MRSIPLSVIKEVKCIGAKLRIDALVNLKGLCERKVNIILPRAAHRPQSGVSAHSVRWHRELPAKQLVLETQLKIRESVAPPEVNRKKTR